MVFAIVVCLLLAWWGVTVLIDREVEKLKKGRQPNEVDRPY